MPLQPHIILITDDQHRGDTLGHMEHPCVRTPHLDQLAYEGCSFPNAYSACPICIPARTSLVTGLSAHRYGSPRFDAGFRINRERSEFLGSKVTAAGYQTCMVGRTHWHTDPSFRAGFETLIGLHQLAGERIKRTGSSFDGTGLGGNELHPVMNHLPPELQSTNWIVDQSLEVLRYRDRTVPLFLWTSFVDPHPAFSTYEPYYSMYDDEAIPGALHSEWSSDDRLPYSMHCDRWARDSRPMSDVELRKTRGVYYGMITNLDFQLGRLFGELRESGIWDDALVIFSSDHGEMLGDFGSFAKSQYLDAAARIPLIVKPPKDWGSPVGERPDAIVQLADLFPTICEAAGATLPADIDAQSLLPIIAAKEERVREHLYGEIDNSFLLHTGSYKYLYFAEDGQELIFDHISDPNDQHDLSSDSKLASELRRRFVGVSATEGGGALESDDTLRNEGKTRPSRAELQAAYTDAWSKNYWDMTFEPRATHYRR